MKNAKTLFIAARCFRTAKHRINLVPSTSQVTKYFSTFMRNSIKFPQRQGQYIFGWYYLFNVHLNTLQCSLYTSNGNDNKLHDETETGTEEKFSQVEYQLIGYMDGWEIEKAVDLLRDSVKIGILPKRYLVINLLQLLGNLGDFECVLSLREILMDNRLCSNGQFFSCLQEAYYHSGRLDEAVLLLRILYQDVRKYEEVDVFFTLIGVMILVHFPHRFDMMENFAKDCRDKEPADFLPTAGLWKCLMLTENFEKAQSLVSEQKWVQKYLPLMLNDILQRKNKVQVNRVNVLKHFAASSVDFKRKNKGLIYSELVIELGKERRWDELLVHLKEMDENLIQFTDVAKVEYHVTNAEEILFNEELDNFILIQCIDKLKALCAK